MKTIGIRLTIISISFIVISLMFTGKSSAKIDLETCVGMWLLDEGSGTTAKDSSENKNDGTLENGPKWVDGKFGKALSFDGVDDYVDCGSNGSLSVTETTMMAWMGPNSISLRHAITGKQGAYSFKIWEVGKLAFTTPGIKDHISIQTLIANQWQHVAVTFKPSTADGCKFYKNGEFVSSTASSAINTTTDNLFLGNNQWNERFNGTIDEVAIFNAALTEADIKSLMNGFQSILAVSSSGKLTTTWATIKTQ